MCWTRLLLLCVCVLPLVTVTSSQPLPLPSLPYAYNALEPYISEEIMKLHHLQHHNTYTTKLNAALSEMRAAGHKAVVKLGIDRLLADLTVVPSQWRNAVRNHGGGYVNHALFWKLMSPPTPSSSSDTSDPSLSLRSPSPSSSFTSALNSRFGSIDEFRNQFNTAATNLFGSGWTWLIVNGTSGELSITTTMNQDTPVMDGHTPILALDVWEHAYYPQYKNRRPEYISAFWHVVNWPYVEELFEQSQLNRPKQDL